MSDRDYGFSVDRLPGVVLVDLVYPRQNEVKEVEVGLECVRAADSIRISYDFDRDGWVIKQASIFSWRSEEEANDLNAEDWQEVAFVPAWGRDRDGDEIQSQGAPK